MKTMMLLASLGMSCLATYAGDSAPETSRIIAEWKALPQGLFNQPWTFWRSGRPVGDGGSVFFDFRLSDNQVVSVVAAHTSYWSKNDFDGSRQPFFVYFGQKMHRFDPGTAEEQTVKKAITAALASMPIEKRNVLNHLLERIDSRQPLFKSSGSEQAVSGNRR